MGAYTGGFYAVKDNLFALCEKEFFWWIASVEMSVAAIIGIYFLQVYSLFENTYMANSRGVLTLSSLLMLTGLTIWAVRDSWETNLRNLREAYDLTDPA